MDFNRYEEATAVLEIPAGQLIAGSQFLSADLNDAGDSAQAGLLYPRYFEMSFETCQLNVSQDTYRDLNALLLEVTTPTHAHEATEEWLRERTRSKYSSSI